MDTYQKRYLKHQKFKKDQILELMKKRYSERIFSEKKIESFKLVIIKKMIEKAPSSCNRKAVLYKIIEDRDDKQLLGGILVGGAGWIHRTPTIILLFAHRFAYKENLFYMPYLDAGFVANQIYLTCEAIDLKCCFVNPNIRPEHYKIFDEYFMEDKSQEFFFCGAMAIGYKEKK